MLAKFFGVNAHDANFLNLMLVSGCFIGDIFKIAIAARN